MESLSTSLILLVLALVLLWLAVTDRLSRALDAYDVLTGKRASAATTTGTATPLASVTPTPQMILHLPSVPALGHSAFVEAV